MKKRISLMTIAMIMGVVISVAQDKIVTLPEIRVSSIAAVNQDVANAFRRTFPDAENTSWFIYDREYIAKFIVKDMDHNALFRKNGVMIYDISYGYEENLKKDVRDIVNKAYDNYKIIRTICIKAQGRDIWMVKLEGMKKYVTVRVEDGEIDEVESFFKADAS
jgi:hypothetical protein